MSKDRNGHQNVSKIQRHIGKDGPQEKGRYFEKLGGADPYQLAPSTWIRDDPILDRTCRGEWGRKYNFPEKQHFKRECFRQIYFCLGP